MRSKLFNPFLIGCAVGAVLVQALAFLHYGSTFDVRLLFFLVLLLMNNHYQIISVQTKGDFSINFPLLFPIIACFGPAWAGLLSFVGLISLDEFDYPWSIFFFNRGALAIATVFSGIVFHEIGGLSNLSLSLPMALITYSGINHLLFVIATYLRGEPIAPIRNAILNTIKTLLPSTALSALFFAAFQYFDVFGIIGAYFVFITFRSGALLGHLESNYRISLIRALLRAVYAKDPDLMEHLENVAYYSKRLAKACGYPLWKLHILDEASYFHDIGKLEISDDILKKNGTLTKEEYKEMQCHPELGIEFLQEISLPQAHKNIVENITGCHHERYDGQGYPHGLAGEEIPIEARIVAVADTWDAMVGKRCYRDPLPIPEAIAELRRVKGTQLDPHLVEVFIQLVEDDLEQTPETLTRSLIPSAN